MPLAGRRLVDRVLAVLRGIFDDLLMVTNSPDLYADLGLRMVPDLVAGKGALGGIHSAVHHAATPHCLVVACDMPFLNAGVLRYLVEQRAGYDVVVPSVHGRPQPLHAVYGKACLQPIARRLETERLNVVSFFPGRAGAGGHGGGTGRFRPRGPVVSQPEHAGGVRRRGAPG